MPERGRQQPETVEQCMKCVHHAEQDLTGGTVAWVAKEVPRMRVLLSQYDSYAHLACTSRHTFVPLSRLSNIHEGKAAPEQALVIFGLEPVILLVLVIRICQ